MSSTRISRRGTPYSPTVSTPSADADELRTRARQLLSDPFSRLMRETFGTAPSEMLGWNPAAEVVESAQEFTVSLELAGMKASDVAVDFTDGVLSIRGERSAEREDKDAERRYHVWERSYGSFVRSFEFPNTVDAEAVHAELAHGMLKVHVPKRASAASNGRRVPVSEKK